MSDLQPGPTGVTPARRRGWRPTKILIAGLAILIMANETQRVAAQWQGHRERQAQLYIARANELKLDKVIQQNDLQLELLMRHSTDLDRLNIAERERDILRRQRAQPQ